MQNIFDEWSAHAIELFEFFPREQYIDAKDTHIYGVSGSGKSQLIASYLLQKPKTSYLYIDCRDIRLQNRDITQALQTYILEQSINIVVLDNFDFAFALPQCKQRIVASTLPYINQASPYGMRTIPMSPFRFSEFQAAYAQSDDPVSAFLKQGCFAALFSLPFQNQLTYLQHRFAQHSSLAVDIAHHIANSASNRISILQIYSQLQTKRKLSKDMLYATMQRLQAEQLIFFCEKFQQPRAVKKLFFCDHALFTACADHKQFFRVFETAVFNELRKRQRNVYYVDKIDFIANNQVFVLKPFSDSSMLFQLVEQYESHMITLGLESLYILTLKASETFHHPHFSVQMQDFESWAMALN